MERKKGRKKKNKVRTEKTKYSKKLEKMGEQKT
jgi:hypothetical protein